MTIHKGTKPASNVKSLLILLLLVLAIPITVAIFLIQTRYFTKATEYRAQYYFVPVSAVMPPDQTVEIMMNSGAQKVAFVDTQLTFDPSKVQLAQEIQPSTVLTTVHRKTSKDEANSTGRIELVFSIWPGDATPSGLFSIAKIPFKAISAIPNDSASLQIISAESQIVDIDSNELTPVSDPYVFTLNNQQATAAPTQAPSATTTQIAATPTCSTPPACLYQQPVCLLAEPEGGWCESTITPVLTATGAITNTQPPTEAITLTLTPTTSPTATVSGDIIPNAPFWFYILPQRTRNFFEQLYLLVFVFRRNSTFKFLLDGIVNSTN